MNYSTETIVSYLNGTLERTHAERIEKACRHDATLKRRVREIQEELEFIRVDSLPSTECLTRLSARLGLTAPEIVPVICSPSSLRGKVTFSTGGDVCLQLGWEKSSTGTPLIAMVSIHGESESIESAVALTSTNEAGECHAELSITRLMALAEEAVDLVGDELDETRILSATYRLFGDFPDDEPEDRGAPSGGTRRITARLVDFEGILNARDEERRRIQDLLRKSIPALDLPSQQACQDVIERLEER